MVAPFWIFAVDIQDKEVGVVAGAKDAVAMVGVAGVCQQRLCILGGEGVPSGDAGFLAEFVLADIKGDRRGDIAAAKGTDVGEVVVELRPRLGLCHGASAPWGVVLSPALNLGSGGVGWGQVAIMETFRLWQHFCCHWVLTLKKHAQERLGYRGRVGSIVAGEMGMPPSPRSTGLLHLASTPHRNVCVWAVCDASDGHGLTPRR